MINAGTVKKDRGLEEAVRYFTHVVRVGGCPELVTWSRDRK